MGRTGKKRKTESPELQGIQHGDWVEYPFVVVHWMPGVYGRRRVIFRREGETGFDGRDFVLAHPDPYDGEKRFAEDAFMELIQAIRATVRKYDRRMCLVISPVDSFYVEPDGRVTRSSEPPSGGLEMDFDLELKGAGGA
jgi:hypothetical protein